MLSLADVVMDKRARFGKPSIKCTGAEYEDPYRKAMDKIKNTILRVIHGNEVLAERVFVGNSNVILVENSDEQFLLSALAKKYVAELTLFLNSLGLGFIAKIEWGGDKQFHELRYDNMLNIFIHFTC